MESNDPSLPQHAVVAGFGLAGRLIVDALQQRGISYWVIERNPLTIRRCAATTTHILEGEVTDEALLRQAGIERATLLALTMPNESAVNQAIQLARTMNPTCYILARTAYTSGGLHAMKLGANDAVVAEQTVALEFARLTSIWLSR